ncbi:MAG: SGNH/GDSL hydrolase family protein [Ignavibacteriaceae bacterium]
MKKTFKIISWNILVVILLLSLLEAIVRIIFPEIQLSGLDRRILEPNVYSTSVGLKKNSVGKSNGVLKQVGENGFWEYTSKKKGTARKILILGDSATMGIGVENDSTFVGLLNLNFKDDEFFNASLIGYSSQDYLNVVRSLIQLRENELGITDVYIFWCLNDIYSNLPDLNSPETKNDYIQIITDFLVRNSKLYHLLKNTLSDRPRAYFDYDKQFYFSENKQLEKSLLNIEQITELLDSTKTNIQLFLLPYEYQIRNYNDTNIFHPQRTFKQMLRASKLTVTDCSAAFNQSGLNSYQFYLYGDGIHFSKTGHRVLAKYIAKALLK